ncbi:MAG: protein-disulfide reductase DsbD family protein [Alphaproteobacteria bacterium]|jgi:suppressor for copper-sensitivity B|nr:thioredoxin family protein [Alphaproteobacteria bacterium]
MLSLLRLMVFTLAALILSPQVTKIYAAEEKPVHVAVISSVSTTGAQGTLLLGIKFTLEKGWKIYAPPREGDDPFKRYPQFEWQLDSNFKPPLISWPTAKEFHENGEVLYGYDKDVILPLTIDPIIPGKPLHLKGKVKFLACSSQCVPVTKDLSFDLPAGLANPTPEAYQILAFRTGNNTNTAPPTSLWLMLVFAFLGGLILNAMPCVLPVLSLKVRSFITLKKDPVLYKKSLLFSWLGIMASFALLAFLAIILKEAGQAAGWGLHFQSPFFLLLMALLMAIFAKGLWNDDSFQLPPALQHRLNNFLDAKHPSYQVFYENFFSGVFATMLATPCTAPFLGSALGYGLSRGPFEILLIFAFMGFGFALPYALLYALAPRQLPLPKQGPWMEILSRCFSVIMAVTSLWLLWVFSHHVTLFMACLVIGLLLSGVILAYMPRKPVSYLGKAFVTGAFITVLFSSSPLSQNPLEEPASLWKPFEENRLQMALKEGKIVIVDVTASWCTTCQVNKALVLNTKKILNLLKDPQILALKADWTTHNNEITHYLARFERAGIPFNVVYGPKAHQGIVLPELLSESDVLDALQKAGHRAGEPRP